MGGEDTLPTCSATVLFCGSHLGGMREMEGEGERGAGERGGGCEEVSGVREVHGYKGARVKGLRYYQTNTYEWAHTDY